MSWLVTDIDLLSFLIALVLATISSAKKRLIDKAPFSTGVYLTDTLTAAILIPLLSLFWAVWVPSYPIDDVVASNRVLLAISLMATVVMTIKIVFTPGGLKSAL